MDTADAVITVIADAESNKLLGVQIVAKDAFELIATEPSTRTTPLIMTLKEVGRSVNNQAFPAGNK